MRRTLLWLLPIATLAVSCDGGFPTSPNSGVARITGSVVGSAGSSSANAGAPSAGMNVSVVGGGSAATIDVNGTFTLTRVRPGVIELRFTGTGVNTVITIGQIEAGDDITIRITRDGVVLKLDRMHKQGRDKVEVEGRIDGLPLTTAAGTFTIGGLNIQTNAETQFVKGDVPATFADLRLGMRVHVKGTPNANGVLAKIVRIQNEQLDLEFQLDGNISNLSGTASDFQFIVEGRLVRGNASTEFHNTTFASLANGVRVQVKGQIRIGFILATRIQVH